MIWHIGCSGFSYKEWKEVFYPKGLPANRWFQYYTEHFNTLELNVTFYRFPSLSILQGWYSKAPQDFTFSAKVPRLITHLKKFNGTHQSMQDFYSVLQYGLAEKLGAVLFQLPPSFMYSEENLHKILGHVRPTFQNVVEFRNASWWRQDVHDLLAENGVSFCGVSFPGITPDDAVMNTSVAYYRFHGVPVLFHSEYDDSFLQKIYAQLNNNQSLNEAYVYFNNTASAAALRNAMYLQQLAAGAP